MITLPGLIDPHTHPRGLPPDDYKEDFFTCTSAALAGGFTTIFDMPNNPKRPTLTEDLLNEKQDIARKQIVCDVGFIFGTNGQNLDEFAKAEKQSLGLKVFLNVSTGNLVIDLETFKKVCQKWTIKLPIFLHAEESLISKALKITKQSEHATHICHVSSEKELRIILKAKEQGSNVTCGVTPHHLFLTEENLKNLGNFGKVTPTIKSQKDIDFLWKNLDKIDVIESDHAPHSIEEKKSESPPVGLPGLETTLPLLLTAVTQNKITINDIKRLCHDNPAKIFNISNPSTPSAPSNPSTYIEIDENEEWTIANEKLLTKCKWSPFNGWLVKGKIKRVFIRKTKVFENGKILVKRGYGQII